MRYKFAISLALLSCSSNLLAQTSSCMSMGSDMVNCHNSNGSTTNCISMGADMATCTTTGDNSRITTGSQPDSGTALGRGISDLVHSIKERSFRSKVGKLLAAGDCQGAARYSLQQGRIELGNSILIQCSAASSDYSKSSQNNSVPSVENLSSNVSNSMLALDVPGKIAFIAQNAKLPVRISQYLTLTRIEALGVQLLMTGISDRPDQALSGKERVDFTSAICSDNAMLDLFRAGASTRTVALDSTGAQVGALVVSAKECGLN